MLSDLKKVQDNFYTNDSIEQFLTAHPIFEAIKMLNKTNKNETKQRIKQFFYKIAQSNSYKEFLLAGVDESKQNKTEFVKYIQSENSQEYFQLLQKKSGDVIALLDSSPSLISMIFSLVHSNSFGIKMIKLFSDIYSKYSDHNCLYSQQIKQQLEKGLQSEDTVVQMRFVEIIVNIAIHGGRAFLFVKQALQRSLDIYETQDILLKLNIVQIISILGDGAETSQLLRGHKIWSKVEKDALDNNQEFYVRKYLLILLVNMATYQQYQMTPKFIKSTIQFLGQCFKGHGQELEAGLQISSHLLRSNQGAKVLIQNSQVFGSFLKLSRSPQDGIKNLFVQNLTMLTDKTNGKKTKPMVMNLLNCVGNPNLSNELSQNMNSNNFMVQGIEGFCQWFVALLQLPFQDLQIKLIHLFYNLLEYNQICECLFEDHGTTKYILKPVGKSNTTKVLRSEKNKFVIKLIEKGNKQWKNTKLETYAVMIEKQLQKEKMEIQYALDTN